MTMQVAMKKPTTQQYQSLTQDTSAHHCSPSDCQVQPQDELDTIPEEEEEPQTEEQSDPADQDT